MKQAYVKYDAAGRLISSVLKKSESPPKGAGWIEVPESLCCSQVAFPEVTANTTALKGFIRYDKKGRVVQGSTIIRKKIPKDGKWVSIPYLRCC